MSDSILLFSRYDDATVINIFVEFLKIPRISRDLTLDMIAVHLTVLYQQGPRRQVADAPSSQPTTLEVPVPRDNFAIGRPRRRKHYRVHSDQSLVRSRNRICRRVCWPSLLHFLPIWKKAWPVLPECVNRRMIARSSLRKGVTVVVDKLQRQFLAKRFSCSHVPPLPYDRI